MSRVIKGVLFGPQIGQKLLFTDAYIFVRAMDEYRLYLASLQAEPETCVPGASTACACADLSQGAQSCLQTGVYGACICVAPPLADSGIQDCIPGQSEACICENGLAGAQICNISGNGFDPCVCDPYLLNGWR